jgi:hypothetical protein
MKRTIIVFASGLVMGLAIMSVVPKAQPTPGSVAIAAPAPAAMAMPMNHCPNIHHAVEALRAAEDDMTMANNDFCGHKEEAMSAAGHALEQLHLAEECNFCK